VRWPTQKEYGCHLNEKSNNNRHMHLTKCLCCECFWNQRPKN
jgi:hypothetical protein